MIDKYLMVTCVLKVVIVITMEVSMLIVYVTFFVECWLYFMNLHKSIVSGNPYKLLLMGVERCGY